MTLREPFGFHHLEETRGVVDQSESFELELSSWEIDEISTLFSRVNCWAEKNLAAMPVHYTLKRQPDQKQRMALLHSPSVTLRISIPDVDEQGRREAFEAVRPQFLVMLDTFGKEMGRPPTHLGPLTRDHPDFDPGRAVQILYGPYAGEKGTILRKSNAPDVHWIRLSDGREVEIGDDLVRTGH